MKIESILRHISPTFKKRSRYSICLHFTTN